MRATGMTDDDANNRSLQTIVQHRCKELNTGKVPQSVNDSSAKYPPTVSALTLPSTDASSITSHIPSSSSGIKRKHPPLTKQIRKASFQKQQVYANKKTRKWPYKRALKEVTIMIERKREESDQGKEYCPAAEYTRIISSKHNVNFATYHCPKICKTGNDWSRHCTPQWDTWRDHPHRHASLLPRLHIRRAPNPLGPQHISR